MIFKKSYEKGFEDGEDNFLNLAVSCIKGDIFHNYYSEKLMNALSIDDLKRMISIKRIQAKYDRKESV